MKNPLLYLCLPILLCGQQAAAQINAYAKVTAISGVNLTLSNANQTYHTFAAGEQVIIMQMQDNVIGSNTADNASFGSLSSILNAGVYEIATISSVTATTMKLTAALKNTFSTSTSASVQVISFNTLSTGDYTTTANITAVSWDGNIGGVVAFKVGGTLTLANSVIVDGQGFRGGAVSSNHESLCEPRVYDTTSNKYAFKGEGIFTSPTITYTSHNGRGPLLNGGGGGSDDNGGGGGGGNYTAGGAGGPGYTCTGTDTSGGLGGISLRSYVAYNRVFMGGGGGGGQQNNSVGTAGSNGGGIILIKANKLVTSCSGSVKISAGGASAATSGNDGGGGAGAAGTIVLQVNTFAVVTSCPLVVQANGGNGGSVGDVTVHGGGGGGGQGAIIFSASLPTSNVTTSANNGIGGLNNSTGISSAGSGAGTNNSGIITGLSTVLPVSFAWFTGERSGDANNLYWKTGETDLHQSFTVQRSSSNVASFTPIGIVNTPSDGTTQDYHFIDAAPASGKNYYRITATNFSGKETFSPVVVLDGAATAKTYSIFPNPAGGQFTIRLGANADGMVPVAIVDLEGRPVWTGNCQASGQLLYVSMNAKPVGGIYFVRWTTNGQTHTGRLLIR